MTANHFTILLIVAILLMLRIQSRLQKKVALLQENTCYWSGDHWVTGTPILLSTLNELTHIDLTNSDDESLNLQNWLSEELNRSVRSGDAAYHDDLTLLVLWYYHPVYNQVHIYPSHNPSNKRFNKSTG